MKQLEEAGAKAVIESDGPTGRETPSGVAAEGFFGGPKAMGFGGFLGERCDFWEEELDFWERRIEILLWRKKGDL